jgi:AraC-like DNA-binding protein
LDGSSLTTTLASIVAGGLVYGNLALNVDELASMEGWSRSTLNHHFRGLTAMSPLQFQKQLRLHAARQKMLTEELDAASAAVEVGYESPSQFNREYKRFFGQPPMRDIDALRASL